jgi:hypothetical protein
MSGYKKEYMSMNCASHRGPLVLIDGSPSEDDLYLAGQITARYGQGREAETVEVTIRNQQGEERTILVNPLPAEQIPAEWFV